jgi:hypothetical protein
MGTAIDVTDTHGRKVGTIREEVAKSFIKTYTTYRILDAQDRIVANSVNVEWLGTEILLTDAGGRGIVRLDRPWPCPIGDKWDV